MTLQQILAGRRLPGIDGCRALAVGAVIAYHAGAPVPGDLGVQFFFVLSGFLITWLLLREYASGGSIDVRAFYARRTLRIIPAYMVFLALSFALDRALGDRWPAALTASGLTYTVNYYNALHGHPTTSIAHAWSLAVEEQFYLVWPLALLWLLRHHRSVRAALAIAIGAVCAWRSVAYAGLHLGNAYAYNAFECRFDSLAIGCFVAVVAAEPKMERWSAALSRRWWLPLPVLALIVMSRLGPASYHYSVGFTVDALLLAVFLVQVLRLTERRAWQWLDARVMRWFGALSYPLYLYHVWGLSIGTHTGGPVAGVVAALGLAAGSYYVVERPFLALKGRWGRVVSRQSAQAPA